MNTKDRLYFDKINNVRVVNNMVRFDCGITDLGFEPNVPHEIGAKPDTVTFIKTNVITMPISCFKDLLEQMSDLNVKLDKEQILQQ